MKWGFHYSGPRQSIKTNFCRGGRVGAEMYCTNFGGSRFIGLGAAWGTNFGLPIENVHRL